MVRVIQDLDNHTGRGAFVNEVHAKILKALGCVGVVTDGSVRNRVARLRTLLEKGGHG
jgi:regulator of RNase E activity RraA